MSEYVTWEEIEAAKDVEEADVEVPEWGKTEDGKPKCVRVRGLMLCDQQAIRRESLDADGDTDNNVMEVLMVVHGVKAPAMDASRVEALRHKAAGPINRIQAKIMELSGLTENAMGKAEDQFHS